MSAPRGWDSHIWTEQTMMRLMRADQSMVDIRSNERMPTTFSVPRTVLRFYCPKIPAFDEEPIILEISRTVIQLFYDWTYTGKLETSSWYDVTELYFLGHSLGCIASMRTAMTRMQMVCRDDDDNNTELFHYGHVSVIDDMVGPSSTLFHYIEDTYFNHWRPSDDEGVNDNLHENQKSGLFFKKLFERSFKAQREDADCSCCHDYCKYHGHESEEERLATCGHFITPTSTRAQPEPASITKPDQVQRKARKSKATTNQDLVSEIDDSPLHDTRPSGSHCSVPRAGTPTSNLQASSWLDVTCLAPPDFPADYHARLTSLPLVNTIKYPNWLETGLQAEGVEQLQEPDRVIAAAMAWNAEEYAQTKCVFFDQYAATMQPGTRRFTKDHWRNTLKFGGIKPKERADRLLAMWECLDWLNEKHYTSTFPAPRPHTLADLPCQDESPTIRDSPNRVQRSKKLWSGEEKEALAEIIKDISADPSLRDLSMIQRARIGSERLKTYHGYDRTANSVASQWPRPGSKLTATTSSAKKHSEHKESTEKTFGEAGPKVKRHGMSDGLSYSRPGASTLLKHTLINNSLHKSAAGISGSPGKRAEHWTAQEDEAAISVLNKLSTVANLVHAPDVRRFEECSQRLKTSYGIDRTAEAIKRRRHTLEHQQDVVANKKRELDDEEDVGPQDLQPLGRAKRRKSKMNKSRFVDELFGDEG